MAPPGKLLYVINGAAFFNTRLSRLALAARERGYEVHVALPPSAETARTRELGFITHAIPFSRSGIRPWTELWTLLRLAALYRRIRPSLVHHFTIKPVIYGGLAARWSRTPAVVSTLTGLGFVFSSQSFKARALKPIVMCLLRFSLNLPNIKVVFQNPGDRGTILGRVLKKTGAAALIKGTGVDITEFCQTPEPTGRPIVLFASRMLVEKGAVEFVKMALELRSRGVQARFVMVGDPDPGYPSSIPRERLEAWNQDGCVEWWGQQTRMPEVLAGSSLVCLPSCYGEGVPRILIEAAACGRASVTFDAPGCREIVRHGENGLLVQGGDLEGLARAVEELLAQPQKRAAMGRQGRDLVEECFTQERIMAQYLALYRELDG